MIDALSFNSSTWKWWLQEGNSWGKCGQFMCNIPKIAVTMNGSIRKVNKAGAREKERAHCRNNRREPYVCILPWSHHRNFLTIILGIIPVFEWLVRAQIWQPKDINLYQLPNNKGYKEAEQNWIKSQSAEAWAYSHCHHTIITRSRNWSQI